MNRDSLRPVAIALLAVVVIAMAAATLNSPVTDGGPDRDPGTGEASGFSDSWQPIDLGLGEKEDDDDSDGGGSVHSVLGACIQILRRPSVILGLLGLLGLLSIPIYRRAGVLGVFSIWMVVLPFGVVIHSFLTKCRPPPPEPFVPMLEFGQNESPTPVNATGGPTGAAEQFDPPVLLLVLLGSFLLMLLFGYLRSAGGDEVLPEPGEDPEDEPDEVALSAIGEAAGDAADRLEETATFENEVYRAWREMTDHLDVPNPASSTPGEFARAARDAGMASENVDSLTDLFRDVRYGGAEPTAEREDRAIDALRGIESAYAEEGDG